MKGETKKTKIQKKIEENVPYKTFNQLTWNHSVTNLRFGARVYGTSINTIDPENPLVAFWKTLPSANVDWLLFREYFSMVGGNAYQLIWGNKHER